MYRPTAIENLTSVPQWDLLVIGGGATGLGVALAGSLRGHRVLLLERDDFAAETSSRSTKLIHGGIRYLPQRRWGLLRESLRERRRLIDVAPGWVEPLSIVIPFRSQIEGWKYRAGLGLYETLAGSRGLGGSARFSASELQKAFPWLGASQFSGGWQYQDARFDDARFALAVAGAIVDAGGTVVNGVVVQNLLRDEDDRIRGVSALDRETGQTYDLSASVVINAAGVHVDQFRNSDSRGKNRIVWSRGTHIVVEHEALPIEVGLLVPETDDGRVLFVLPWHGRALVGTTDVPTADPVHEPRPSRAEVDYLLSHLKRILHVTIERRHICSAFAGLRTLVEVGELKVEEPGSGGQEERTADLSRESVLERTEPGLISALGGKWTTFRSQGEQTVDLAEKEANLPGRVSTKVFRLEDRPIPDPLTAFDPPSHETLVGFVRSAVREQMARTVVDVLARRSRVLFVDVERARELAPPTIEIMTRELNRDAKWVDDQLAEFTAVLSQFEVNDE